MCNNGKQNWLDPSKEDIFYENVGLMSTQNHKRRLELLILVFSK